MQLTGETKFFIGLIIATFLIIGIGVAVYSRPEPVLKREELITFASHTRGNIEAQNYLVEFSDYQCPACGTFKPLVDQIVEKYKDKLLFAYRNFPLAQHEFAEKAAETAEAAGEQGKYWEMHDYLFANQANFSDEVFQEGAKKIGLDMDKFNESLKSGKFKSIIQDDLSYGTTHGVNSTPTFFLNGKKLSLFNQSDLETEVAKAIGE